MRCLGAIATRIGQLPSQRTSSGEHRPADGEAAIAARPLPPAPPAVELVLEFDEEEEHEGLARCWDDAAKWAAEPAGSAELVAWTAEAAEAAKAMAGEVLGPAGMGRVESARAESDAVRQRCQEAERRAASLAVERDDLSSRVAAAEAAAARSESDAGAREAEAEAAVRGSRGELTRLRERDGRMRGALAAAAEAQEEAEASAWEWRSRAEQMEEELQSTLVALLRSQNAQAEATEAARRAEEAGSGTLLAELRSARDALRETAGKPSARAAGDGGQADASLRAEVASLKGRLREQTAETRALRGRLAELRSVDVYAGTLSRVLSPKDDS